VLIKTLIHLFLSVSENAELV